MVGGRDKFYSGSDYVGKHLVHNDYHSKNKRVLGTWFGRGCELYGVKAGRPVDVDKEFGALKENKHAITGEPLTRQKERRKAFADLTCSAPKTFSIAAMLGKAMGLENADLIRQWHREACAHQRQELEALTGRQAHNGTDHVERTGNFCAAVYEHTSNRSLEADLHDHTVIANVTRSANGQDYAIEFGEYFNNSRYLTAVYRNKLASLAKAQGSELYWDKYGAPQLVALQGEIKQKSEQRTKQIEELLHEFEEIAGTSLSDRDAHTITRCSRGLRIEEFRAAWTEEKKIVQALKMPEISDDSRRKMLAAFGSLVTSHCDQVMHKISDEQVAEKQLDVYTLDERGQIKTFVVSLDPVRRQELAWDARRDVEFAVAHMFEQQTVVKVYDLYEAIVMHAKDHLVDLEAMKAAVLHHLELVHGLGEQITTLTHYRREVESLKWIAQGRGRGVHIKPDNVTLDWMTPHQNKAVQKLIECQDQFSALSGVAGAGKTSKVLSSVIGANLKEGRKVAIVATSNAAAEVLIAEAGKVTDPLTAEVLCSAVNTDLFLTDPRLKTSLAAGDLLISDESSMSSTEQGHKLLEWAMLRGVRVLFAGDPAQLPSVAPGDCFRLILDKSVIHRAHLTEILRQKPDALDGHYLKSCKLFKAGKTTEAFYELDMAERVLELRGKDRVQTIANLIMEYEEKGIPAMSINPTHAENDAISEAVRRRKHELGQLKDERTVQVHRSLGWSDAEKEEINRLQPGHVLEIIRGRGKGKAWEVVGVEGTTGIARDAAGVQWTFNASNSQMFDVCERRSLQIAIGDDLLTHSGTREITNGTRLRVAGWDADCNPVDEKGRSITGRQLSHAYASTVHKVQGSTTVESIVGLDRNSVRWSSAKIAYTACTRGVRGVTVLVENKSDLALIEHHSGERKAAIEMELDQEWLDPRSEAARLFSELQRVKKQHPQMAKAEAERRAQMCVQVDIQPGARQNGSRDVQQRGQEPITPKEVQKRSANVADHVPDLQELARQVQTKKAVDLQLGARKNGARDVHEPMTPDKRKADRDQRIRAAHEAQQRSAAQQQRGHGRGMDRGIGL